MTPITRFLIVDDEPVIRLAFTRVLSSEGFDVQCAADGPEALRRLQERAYDVVLLDLRLPGMDGLTVLRTIKACWPDTEVIVITGYAALQTAKESVAQGAFDYRAKPIGPHDLIQVTREAMCHKGWTLRQDMPAATAAVQ